jgi:hypothetical protein
VPANSHRPTDPSPRRNFLQTFAGGALASASPLAAVATVGDLYVNHRLGLAFKKPPEWRFENVRTFADIRNEYEYASLSPEVEQMLKQGPLPLAVVSSAPLLSAIGASATIQVEESPLEAHETLASVTSELIRAVSGYVKNFQLLGEPHHGRVSGHESLEYWFTFLYEDRLGNRGPVRHRTLVVLRPPLLCNFNMMDIPADRIDAQREFDAMRESIVFA